MKIKYQTTVNPVRQKTQDIIKASWEKLGITVEDAKDGGTSWRRGR